MLTIATWLIGLLDIQYSNEQSIAFAAVSPDTPSDDSSDAPSYASQSTFPGEPLLWKTHGNASGAYADNEGVTLFNESDKRTSIVRSFALPPAAERFEHTVRVRGIIDTVASPASLPKGDEAAYMIWFRNSQGKSFEYITVQSLKGHKKQYRAEKIVQIPNQAHSFALAMVSRASHGHFKLLDASASLVTTTAAYRFIRPVVFTIWGVCILFIGVWFLKRSGRVFALILTGLIGATLVGVLLPLSITTGMIEPAYDKLLSLVSLNNTNMLATLYKVGHFVFFFLIALLIFYRRKAIQLSAIAVFEFLIIFIVATEGLQLYMFNRSTQLLDMVIDLCGVLLAWIIIEYGINRTKAAATP